MKMNYLIASERAFYACLLCICTLLALPGCSDDGDSNTTPVSDTSNTDTRADGSTSGTSGNDAITGGCSSQNPCTGENEVCDTATAECVARCTENSCAFEQVCDQCRGLCAPNGGKRVCTEQSNCFSDQYCDSCTGLCEERKAVCEACLKDEECAEQGDRCVDVVSATGGRFCGQSCATVLDCPEGYECATGLNQCVPSSGDCTKPAECTDDAACRGSDQICERGRCVPGCTDSGACPSGRVCEFGRCLDACPARACESPLVCDETLGVCDIDGDCRESKDCPLAGTFCDTATRLCVSGCEVDDDCQDARQKCDNGQCVARGCTYAGSCAFEQVCDTASGVCEAAVGQHCDVCDPNAEGACGVEANKCIELKDDQDQSLGNFCFVACDSDPNNRCPQGYQCVPLQDQDGNPAGEVCFRDCTFDPWQ